MSPTSPAYATHPDAYKTHPAVIEEEDLRQAEKMEKAEQRRKEADRKALEDAKKRLAVRDPRVDEMKKTVGVLKTERDEAHGRGVQVHPPLTEGNGGRAGEPDTLPTLIFYAGVEGIINRVRLYGSIAE